MVTLIYRGYTYHQEILAQPPYHKPYALNWRYHAPGEFYGEVPDNPSSTYRQPRAMNWRYQPT